MSKNPVVNAVVASAYIFVLVLVMDFGSKVAGQQTSFMMPVAFISLFTLSAAVMGYLFCYEPLQLYLEGKKKQGVGLFLKTVGVFGGITILMLVLLFLKVFS